jgi:hypothetical protein
MPLDAKCRDASIDYVSTAIDYVARGIVEDSVIDTLNHIKQGFNDLDVVIKTCQ